MSEGQTANNNTAAAGTSTDSPVPSRGRRFGWLKKLLVVVLAIVVVFVVVVAMQPDDFRIVRSTTIAAPPAAVFAQVNDFQKWEAWSPWAKLDPNVKNTFEGPAAGTGAIFKWSGNSEVGEGKMTLTESRPHELIKIKLDFVKPFEDTSNVEFTFKPDGDKTVITWNMAGRNNFISKTFCLFMNMDKMVGGQFEQGLANIKSVVEGAK